MTLTEYLKTLQYPGRFIVIGKSGGAVIGIYGAMGRSASSLARIYEADEVGDIRAVGTDQKVLNEGNPDLLEYRSLRWLDNGFVIANGRQIERVRNLGFLQDELMAAVPEPDEYKTPRVTAVVSGTEAALYMVRTIAEGVESKHWPLNLVDGAGHFISTYVGADVRPTPSFAGDPVEVKLDFASAKDAAEAVFGALAPVAPQGDYRVGFFAVRVSDPASRDLAIVNRNSTNR